jgi:hypothetical protein
VDCPWCQLFQHVLHGHPLTPRPRPAEAEPRDLSEAAA